MNPSVDREEALFAEALDQPASQRDAFLGQACGDDLSLQARISVLLAAHEASDGIMAPPGIPTVLSPEEQPGTCIGRYRLIQKIGEGGCGTVYLAEQLEPIRRRVALKVIKLGMDSLDVVARFEAERQALALMDHPNIANVFDAGATRTGRPFFVMEMVSGTRITTFCDEHQLSLAERLELFIHVCHAIQHAHQKGIIHRDIKPSNILVTMQDGVPVPKVIDFGIAKATHGQLTDRTVLTAIAQFVGTPVYMSPEQAEFSGQDIDTRSDIYSLGVLLYELIAGRPPFDPAVLLRAGLDEIRRQIRDIDPPRPSTRVSTLTDEDRATIAGCRNIEPGRLAVVLRTDLDWIVMRCLEKDRARRYETANGLAVDVQRYLNHEPVVASPPSATYRLRKLVLRHTAFFASAAVVMGVLVVGTVVSTLQAVRATRAERLASARLQSELAARQEAELHQSLAEKQRKVAEEQRTLADEQRSVAEEQRALAEVRMRSETAARQESEQQKTLAEQERVRAQTAEKTARAEMQISRAVSEFLQQDLLRQADSREQVRSLVPANPDLTVREALDRAAGRVGVRFSAQPLVEAGIRNAIGQAYLGIGLFEKAAEHFERAGQLRKSGLGPEHESTLTERHHLGTAYLRLHRLPEATAVLQEVLAARQRTLGPEHPDTLNTMNSLGHVLWLQGRPAEAVALVKPVWEIHQRTKGPENPNTLVAAGNLATLYYSLGRRQEAIPLFETTRVVQERELGADHPDTLVTVNNLATLYHQGGRSADAAPLMERVLEARKRVLSAQHPETLQSMNELATVYRSQGRLEESAGLLEQTVETQRRVLSPEHPDTLVSMSNLGCTYWAQGREADAMNLFSKAALTEKQVLGIEHPDTIKSLSTLAGAYCAQGRYDDAAPLLDETLSVRRRLLGRKSRATYLNARDLGAVYLKQGNFRAAEDLLLRDCFQDLHDAATADAFADIRESQELELSGMLADLYWEWGDPEKSRGWRSRHVGLLRAHGHPVELAKMDGAVDRRVSVASSQRVSTSTTASTSTSTSTNRSSNSSSSSMRSYDGSTSQTQPRTPPPSTTPPSTTPTPPSGRVAPPITTPGTFRPAPPEGSRSGNVGSGSGHRASGGTPPSSWGGGRGTPPGSSSGSGSSGHSHGSRPPTASSGSTSGSSSSSGSGWSGRSSSGGSSSGGSYSGRTSSSGSSSSGTSSSGSSSGSSSSSGSTSGRSSGSSSGGSSGSSTGSSSGASRTGGPTP